MKAVIFCGGSGTRLREETEFRPKPMVNIGNRPILWHIMKIYAHYGYNDFILALGYKGEMIREYFYNYEILNSDFTLELGSTKDPIIHRSHKEEGWKITFVNTGEKALKGARLKKIEPYINDENFLVTYGDGLANIDIDDLIKFHHHHKRLATLAGINIVSRFGELQTDGPKVTSFCEKPTNAPGYINGGFFVFKREIFKYLSGDDKCDLEYGIMEDIAKKGQLMMYKLKGSWACMDTLRDMDYLNQLWQSNKAFWKIWQ